MSLDFSVTYLPDRSDLRDFGVDFSSTFAMRVCQPGPVAFQEEIT